MTPRRFPYLIWKDDSFKVSEAQISNKRENQTAKKKNRVKFMIGFIQIIIKRTQVENMKSAAVLTLTKELKENLIHLQTFHSLVK